MDWVLNIDIWIALLTLTVLEIVLGIDNVIFIAILASKLPVAKQARARAVGLSLAMFMRIGLLFCITWIMSLTHPLFNLFTHPVSGRDIILILGGLFLIGKSTFEIHEGLEGKTQTSKLVSKNVVSFSSTIIQIIMLDLVFSLDSVITAVGMVDNIGVMVAAIIIAVGFMMVFADAISSFIHKHPTIKILALCFLLLIGIVLIADGFGQHISKGYIYFAMVFAIFVEALNLKMRKVTSNHPVKLRGPDDKILKEKKK